MQQLFRYAGAAALIMLAVVTARGTARAQGSPVRWIEPYTGQRVAVDPVAQHVLVFGDNGTITTLNARTGARLQQVTAPGVTSWGPGLVDPQLGRALFLAATGGQGSQAVMLNTQTGSLLTTVAITAPAVALAEDTAAQRIYISESDAAGTIAIVDAGTGRQVDTVQVGAPAAQIAIDQPDGRLFVVTAAASGARVAIVDLASRAVVGSVAVGRDPSSMAVDATTGHVFVANGGDRTVSVIDGRNARLLATAVATATPGEVLVDAAHGRAYVLCRGSGQPAVSGGALGGPVTVGATVDMLDTQTGTVLLRIPVGAPAETMALDTRTGHLFVATAYTTPVNTVLSTPFALVGGMRVVALGQRPTIQAVLWPANTAPHALAMDEADSRVYSVSMGSVTTSEGTVTGFTSMLDETRL